eukprot:scaffold5048_cov83-Skeletonema_marinoi.AAC.8
MHATSNELLIATLIPAISSAFVPTAMVSVTSLSTVSTELAVDVARSQMKIDISKSPPQKTRAAES